MREHSQRSLAFVLSLVSNRASIRKDSSKPYVGLEHIPSGGSSLTSTGFADDSISTNNVFDAGDILFGKLRPRLRKCVRVNFSGYCSTDILVLRPTDKAHPDFAGFVAQSEAVFSGATRTEEGTKMPRCSWRDLQAVKVFCPDNKLAQRRIAAILTSIDTAIEKTEALIEKYQQIKAGLMHDLFTRGVLPNGQLRPPREQAPELYQETSIGWIPRDWQLTKAGAISQSIVPGRDKPILDGGGIPWITVSDLGALYVADSKDSLSISTLSLSKAGGRLIPKGAVILSCVGEFGLASVVSSVLTMNQQLHAFLTCPSVLPEWLAYNIHRQKQYMERIATQTTIKYLNKSGCESIPVLIPHMEEQQSICDRVFRITQRIRSLATDCQKLQCKKLGLMQDLLTGKVPVQVDATHLKSTA